jgi:hypothetical protein
MCLAQTRNRVRWLHASARGAVTVHRHWTRRIDTSHADCVTVQVAWHPHCDVEVGGNTMTKRDLERDDDHIDLESPLGIADEPIAKTPGDHLDDAGSPDDVHRRRRARALGEDGLDGNETPGSRDDHGGASSVDMGYGGEGTDVKRSR